MFHKMPLILLGIIVLISIYFPWMSLDCARAIYAVCLTVKCCIFFLLPFIIFALLCKTAMQLSRQASLWIVCILAMICLSNFCSTMLAYLIGNFSCHSSCSVVAKTGQKILSPLWQFSLPKWISNNYTMFLGLALGISLGYKKTAISEKIAHYLDGFLSYALFAILCMVPIFIAGFFVKILHEETLSLIAQHYLAIFALVSVSVFSYIDILYFLSSNFSIRRTCQSLKNMLPAAIAGFGSMSSVAAMPLTLMGTRKNSQNPDVSSALIPATVNIHLIGDCFAIPIFAFAIIQTFGLPFPAFADYTVFALYFVLTKFSVAAIPGGGILVMLPILETYLGLKTEMLSLITTLYILFDPLITSANVLGNGAFALIAEKFLGKRLQKDSL